MYFSTKNFVKLWILFCSLILVSAAIHAEERVNFETFAQKPSLNIPLTPAEKAWLQQHPTITVAIKSGWMPIEFKLENDKHRGLAIDYLGKIANLYQINFNVVDAVNDQAATNADLISSVSGKSLKNPAFHLLSQPFLILPNAIYVNKNTPAAVKKTSLEDLKASRVAIYKSGPLARELKKSYPHIQLVYVDIADEGFDYLQADKVDAYVGNELVIDYHIEVQRLDFVKKTGLTPFTSNVSMAVRNDEPELASIMEKATSAIGQNNTELLNNWKHQKSYLEVILKWTLLTILCVCLIISFRLYHLKHIARRQHAADQKKIWHQANFDYLTNLPNRHLLQNRLEEAIIRANRRQAKVTLIFIDLDEFKHVNDSAGHSIGDKLLQETATRISNCVRKEDTTARLGGDEFMVVISDYEDTSILENICEKILRSIQEPYKIDKDVFFITASIGITTYPDDSRNQEELLRYADMAMYEGKKLGRNRYQFFTQSMQAAITNKLSMTSDLRTALKAQQFSLYYQPIISLNAQKISKAEALIRWNHPQHGMVYPDDFIHLAEESGLIIELSDWTFDQAIHDLKQIHQTIDASFQLSINVSPFQFSQPESLMRLIDKLQQANIPGHHICLEITESLLLEPSINVINTLNALNKVGINFAIDDFGTGYSALAYLKKFNIDFIKIDKSFVQNLEYGNYDETLCAFIIQMAHKLDIQLAAEGVESEKQYAILKGLRCDFVQGYLFGKPAPLTVLLDTITQDKAPQVQAL